MSRDLPAGWYVTRRDTADPRHPDACWAFGRVGEGDYGDGRTYEQAVADVLEAARDEQLRGAA